MAALLFDLRDALRALRRDPAYAAAIVLTLALTLGSATAVFSIVNGVLLKPLAFRESHRLVAIAEIWRRFNDPWLEVNEQHFEYWRGRARSFESMAQYIALPANLTGPGDATQITLVHASGSLFDVLQTSAAIGRTLTTADEPSGSPNVTVITDRLWRERFGGDRGIIGRAIALDGRSYTVVGVLPTAFRLPEIGRLTDAIDAFVAIRMDAEQVGWVGDHNNAAVGRLKPGVTADAARAELDRLQAEVGVRATQDAHEPVVLASRVVPLADTIVGASRRGLLLLLGAIAAVLLIACSNLANLSLTRTLTCLREASIRSALGASRSRLVMRAVFEQVALAAIGGVAGLGVAWAALGAFVRTAPIDLPRVNEVALDGRVLTFAAVVSLAAGLLVGILPAWRISRRDVQSGLRATASTTTSDRGGVRTRGTLVAVQVALSVVLLVVTGLLAASFVRLLNVDRGFTADNVLAVRIALPASRFTEDVVKRAVYDRALAAVRALPGVDEVSPTSMTPLSGQGQVNFIAREDSTAPRSQQPTANFRFVGPDFFKTLDLAIVRGRPFTDSERGTDRPAPALVSQNVAARLWPGEDPIGRRFGRAQPGEQGFEVVGVVVDAKTTALEGKTPLMVYVPYWWGYSRPSATFLIKTANDPAAIMPSVRRAIRDVDPEIAIGQARPMNDVVDSAMAGRRYQTQLFTSFGIVALLIAGLGVYAVTAYGVSRRRREINIRVALGARPSDAMALIVRQGAVPIAAGVAVGTAAALAAGRLFASLLFEVSARDPYVVVPIVALTSAIGLGACVAAAKQGLAIDPAAALREE